MRFVELSTATTLAVDLPERADATPTFVVRGPSGGIVQTSSAVTLDTVNTTLSGAASAGAVTVSVASATGITRGRKYLLTGNENAGGERVTVKSVSGTTVTLVRPTRIAHLTAATFQSTRMTCAIAAASVGSIARHYRLEITYAVATATAPVAVFPFDVVRIAPTSTLTADDIADLDPIFAKRIAAGVWVPSLIERAWEMLCRRVAAKVSPGALLGSRDFTTPHSYLVQALVLEGAGDDYEKMRDLKGARFQQEFDAACAETPVDNDQDGAVESNEGIKPRTIQLQRG